MGECMFVALIQKNYEIVSELLVTSEEADYRVCENLKSWLEIGMRSSRQIRSVGTSQR
jgi:hypothetical protein